MFHLRYRCSSCQSRNVCLPACIGGSGSSSDLPSVSVIPDVICRLAAPRWMSLCARHCFTVSGTAEGQNGGREGTQGAGEELSAPILLASWVQGLELHFPVSVSPWSLTEIPP